MDWQTKLGLDTGETYVLLMSILTKRISLRLMISKAKETAMCVWLSLDSFNEIFDNDSDYFNAYASNEPLDVEGAYLVSELTPADMDKDWQSDDEFYGRHDEHACCGIGYDLLDFNVSSNQDSNRSQCARSISYMKVFGYRNGEIDRLYLTPITETVVVSLIATIPILIAALTALFKSMLMDMNGNIPIYVPFSADGDGCDCGILGLLSGGVPARAIY